MKKDLTELVFILDRSGSMAGLEKDTIGGFNAMIEKQKKEVGQALVTTVLFDHENEMIHDRVDLQTLPAMTEKEYYVRGCTALLDAVGSTIEHIRAIHKYIRKEDLPEKTLFVITTDGMENSSHQYTYKKVQDLIKKQKKNGWEFLFLGANIDAAKEAARFGIDADFAADYHADSKGTDAVYAAVNDAVCCMRASQPMTATWKKKVDADFRKRRK